VATVNGTGLVTGVDGGDVEIRATYQNVAGTLRVTVPTPQTFTLVGVVTQTGSTTAISGATVRVTTGINTGRSSSTDGNGYYSIGGLRTGTFTLQGSRSGFENTDRSVTLSGDLRADFAMRADAAAPPPPLIPTPAPGSNQCNVSSPIAASCGTATAVCNDGTYSCSQNRSGTCSSHQGVRCWICPGPLC
jgi:hypothetical protein